MDDEIIPTPTGDIRIPARLPLLDAHGFLLRTSGHRLVLEILGTNDGSPNTHVIARLAFEPQSFTRFVRGLVTVNNARTNPTPETN